MTNGLINWHGRNIGLIRDINHDKRLPDPIVRFCLLLTTIRCLVIALLMLIRYMTLWRWPLTFWPCSVTIHGGSRGQPLHKVWRSYGYPFLSDEFW